MFHRSQIQYTLLGENIIEFKVINEIDEHRISGEDENCTYVFYKKDCYDTLQKAINGMYVFLTRYQFNSYRNNPKEIDEMMIDAEGRN